MKNYVYLAEDRIKTLYDSLGLASQKKNETNFKIDAKIVSTSHSSTETIDVSLVGKLTAVLEQIESTDDLSTDDQFIKGKLPLAWDTMALFELSGATFWIGKFECSENDPCSNNKMILIGSMNNIIGNRHELWHVNSFSYPRRFFQALKDAFDDELTIKDAKDNGDKSCVIDDNHATSKWIRLECCSSDFQHECARCINMLFRGHSGNYCEYEFVAQKHFSFILQDDGTQYTRYIVAAPLYVCQTRTIGSRTILVNGKRKCILSSDEYEKHKKNGFKNLDSLLVNEGLKQEGETFKMEMKTIMDSNNSRTRSVKRHYTTEDFQDIIDKYFVIINKPQ